MLVSALPKHAPFLAAHAQTRVAGKVPARHAEQPPMRHQQRFGEVFRLINDQFGYPMPPANKADVVMRTYRSFTPQMPTGSDEALKSAFVDPAGFPIVVVNKDGMDFRNSITAIEKAVQGPDPYISDQALTARRLLQKAVEDRAVNLDVSEVVRSPGKFPIDQDPAFAAQQNAGMASPQAPGAMQQALDQVAATTQTNPFVIGSPSAATTPTTQSAPVDTQLYGTPTPVGAADASTGFDEGSVTTQPAEVPSAPAYAASAPADAMSYPPLPANALSSMASGSVNPNAMPVPNYPTPVSASGAGALGNQLSMNA